MKKLLLCGAATLAIAAPAFADELQQNAGMTLIGNSSQSSGNQLSLVQPVAFDAAESMTLNFVFHIDDGMAEQDVFYEKVPGSGEVFRPTAATRNMDAPLCACR